MVTNQDPSVNVYLSDISKKDKKWDKHKSDCVEIANALFVKKEFFKRGYNLNDCAEFLIYNPTDDIDKPLRLTQANFCRDRACPICQWRRSLRWAATMKKQLSTVFEKYPNHRCIFVTLTVKNCDITELRETIQSMNKGFSAFFRKLKKLVPNIGYLKSVEVTRNEKTDKAHPHFHITFFVPPSYFTINYIKHYKWQDMWMECMKLDYSPMVNVKAVKIKKNSGQGSYLDAASSAIVETIKYSIKPSDLLKKATEDGGYEWMYEYLRQVKGLRFAATGGIVKGMIKPEWEKDEENEDLIHVGGEEKTEEKTENEKEPTEIIFNFDRFLWRYKH